MVRACGDSEWMSVSRSGFSELTRDSVEQLEACHMPKDKAVVLVATHKLVVGAFFNLRLRLRFWF